MASYFYLLCLSFAVFGGTVSYISWVIRKRRKGVQVEDAGKGTVFAGFLLLISAPLFFSILSDLPKVLFGEPDSYEGKCEIILFEGRGGTVEAEFMDKSVSFPPMEYPLIEEGSYYCKVAYYPSSLQGTELQLYEGDRKVDLK